jgi:hypothetical protein
MIRIASEGRGLFQGAVKAAMKAVCSLHIAASCFPKQVDCYFQNCIRMNLFLHTLRFLRM